MFRARTLILTAALGAVTMGLMACTSSHSAQDPRTAPQLAELSLVQSAGLSQRAFSGVVSARVQSNLGFRVSGKVIERLVDSGQAVHEGPAPHASGPNGLHACHTVQVGNVDAARARLQQAAADEARYGGLVASVRCPNRRTTRSRLPRTARGRCCPPPKRSSRWLRMKARTQRLLADADGTVMETLAEPGQFVSAGQIVVRLARSGAREAAVNLPETLRPALGSTALRNPIWSGCRFGHAIPGASPAIVGRCRSADPDVRGPLRAGGGSSQSAARGDGDRLPERFGASGRLVGSPRGDR